MKTNKRYLPLLNSDGNWIERIDLMLISRLALADSSEGDEVRQLYEIMKNANNATPKLNQIERSIETIIRKNKRERMFAASVALTIIQLSQHQGYRASLQNAAKVVASSYHEKIKRSSPEGLTGEVKRAFRQYRATSHLQAAMHLETPSIGEIELSDEKSRAFMSTARSVEILMDRSAPDFNFDWNPWRIPECIQPNPSLPLPTLSKVDLSILTPMGN